MGSETNSWRLHAVPYLLSLATTAAVVDPDRDKVICIKPAATGKSEAPLNSDKSE